MQYIRTLLTRVIGKKADISARETGAVGRTLGHLSEPGRPPTPKNWPAPTPGAGKKLADVLGRPHRPTDVVPILRSILADRPKSNRAIVEATTMDLRRLKFIDGKSLSQDHPFRHYDEKAEIYRVANVLGDDVDIMLTPMAEGEGFLALATVISPNTKSSHLIMTELADRFASVPNVKFGYLSQHGRFFGDISYQQARALAKASVWFVGDPAIEDINRQALEKSVSMEIRRLVGDRYNPHIDIVEQFRDSPEVEPFCGFLRSVQNKGPGEWTMTPSDIAAMRHPGWRRMLTRGPYVYSKKSAQILPFV